MARTVLITGGAGFIGAHLVGQLLEEGHRVRAIDSLLPQVHGGNGRPAYLEAEVDLVEGDVRNPDMVRKALVGVDAVVHLAAGWGSARACTRWPSTPMSTESARRCS